MDHVLDSPLEALTFNYVSFGIFSLVNNLWPLVAVITAAVSFWKIKAAAGITPLKKLVDDTPAAPLSCVNHREKLLSSMMEEEASTSCSSPASVVTPDQSGSYDGMTKGRNKFVLYYEDDGGEMTVASEEKEYSSDCDDGGMSEERYWGSWERMLRMRTAEMGWYRYQDLTVINGNVVRLWEEGGGGKVRQVEAYSSGCVVW
ncbi:hypothetical protein SLEP1_g28420 [Rubroshorea leprosula]|uniref:Uncharacterized protein n=1 Tax=Rubroshorea leprosula TaxID=152421 RepID=A0AAV5K4I1_9ROSI|nr:hypothetical protein SLEP1_g28420 [Rubroshorea leprosula]